jgi:hypothetical protein
MEDAQKGVRTWREVKRMAADIGSWKSFAPTQESTGNDDDDYNDDESALRVYT